MYNNQELVLGIWRIIIELIQNLDIVLVDLKGVGITIAIVKSQF